MRAWWSLGRRTGRTVSILRCGAPGGSTAKSRSVSSVLHLMKGERLIGGGVIIGVPDAEARLAIFNVLLSKTPHSIAQEDLRELSARMHGYVGADISAVVREAGTLAIKGWLKSPEHASASVPSSETLTLELDHLVAAMPAVRPSAMRSLFVEAPPVRYADIGGQASVIQKLRETVEWPLRHPGAFSRLGVRPPKGILLYGPPGCSKTVLARACACESGVNFVAVKGPEVGLPIEPVLDMLI